MVAEDMCRLKCSTMRKTRLIYLLIIIQESLDLFTLELNLTTLVELFERNQIRKLIYRFFNSLMFLSINLYLSCRRSFLILVKEATKITKKSLYYNLCYSIKIYFYCIISYCIIYQHKLSYSKP